MTDTPDIIDEIHTAAIVLTRSLAIRGMLESTRLISMKHFTDLFAIINVLVAVGPVISGLAHTEVAVASVKASSEEAGILCTVVNPVLAIVSLELLRTGTLVIIHFILTGSAVLAR